MFLPSRLFSSSALETNVKPKVCAEVREDRLMALRSSWLVESQSRASETACARVRVWGGGCDVVPRLVWPLPIEPTHRDERLQRQIWFTRHFDLSTRREVYFGHVGSGQNKNTLPFLHPQKKKNTSAKFGLTWRCVRQCVVPGMVGVPEHLCMKAMCESSEAHREQLYAREHLTFSVSLAPCMWFSRVYCYLYCSLIVVTLSQKSGFTAGSTFNCTFYTCVFMFYA